jgi:hypothetical protein
LPPIEAPPECQVLNRVQIGQVGSASIDPIDTSCAVALRMAMWEHHGLQPAARAFLGADITQIRQIGSYNCRAMRTTNGDSGRMSSHATANAIDITGFDLLDGRRLRLTADWVGDDADARFLRAARDTACDWFRVTLSPDYNALHVDHFHLQSTGSGLCR